MFLIAVGGLLTLGLVLASAIWASRESDAAALQRQRELVDSRLRSQAESVAFELDSMAVGFASTISGVLASGKLQAFDGQKFSEIITSVSRYDEAFVVWSDGEMAIERGPETAAVYRWIKPLVMPLLRSAVQSAFTKQEQEARGSIELMRLQGRPSIAGIVPIKSAVRSPSGQTLYLVAYRYLDGPALDALSREQGLNGARFARSSDPEPNEVSFQIEATATGEPIGFIIWEPDLPGSKVIASLIPALAGAAVIIAVLFAVLILLLRRSLADLQHSEQTSRHRSLHDILTSLPNRALFDQHLQDHLARQKSSKLDLSVALIDLDKFKAVNDTLGHAAGDALIQMAAERISAIVGKDDVLARLGGDEFSLLLPNGVDQASPRHREICAMIVEELSRPFLLLDGKASASIGCSIGITRVLASGLTSREILDQADIALYEAKSLGRGRFVEYLPSMDTTAKLRETLKADLRSVLNSGHIAGNSSAGFGIEVFYQTIHDARDPRVISGAEALARWRHPEHGLLSPDKFIPLAEDSGLIVPLGEAVLQEACRAASSWPEPSFVSVNVSAVQLRSAKFADMVLRILRSTGLSPHRLELEVTETALMESEKGVVCTTLQRLRENGVRIALDDFGTGYSSLSHLIQFPVDRLKIDRSFVALLGTRADGAAIVSAIVTLARNLGIGTTAEGVETAGQRDLLISLGCTDLQGYLFARPQPITSLPLAIAGGPDPASIARRS